MVTIVVIAHSEFANSLASCIEHILAKRINDLHIIPVRKTEDSEHIFRSARELINRILNDNKQVLILTDIFGATPSNIATKLIKRGKVEMITGLNMPMLLRAVSYSDKDMKTCIEKALEGARNGIVYLNEENI